LNISCQARNVAPWRIGSRAPLGAYRRGNFASGGAGVRTLAPILRAVVNVQNFNRFGFQRTDDDIAQGRKRQYPLRDAPFSGNAKSVSCAVAENDTL